MLVSVTGVLTACGEERFSKPEYERLVRSSYADVQRAFRATNVPSLELLGRRVAAAQAALRRSADRLEDAEPPTEVEEENEELVEGLRDYAEQLDELRAAVARGDRAAIRRFNSSLANNEAIERIAEAAEEMKREGYDLGPIAEE
jgi:prephenate dehydrogenase